MSFTESNDRCGAPQSPGCIHPPTHYVSYLSATAGIRYGDGPLQPATVFTRVCGWCVDGIPSRLTVELLSEIAPPVQLAEADVNERPDELQSPEDLKRDVVNVLRMIARDMGEDAKAFDGKPFTGATVAEYMGNQGAAIAALANILAAVLDAPAPHCSCGRAS